MVSTNKRENTEGKAKTKITFFPIGLFRDDASFPLNLILIVLEKLIAKYN